MYRFGIVPIERGNCGSTIPQPERQTFLRWWPESKPTDVPSVAALNVAILTYTPLLTFYDGTIEGVELQKVFFENTE